MVKRILLLLLLVPNTSWAADQYWAECTGSGGAGLVTDPYCLDEDSDSIDESFQEAWDGVGSPADVAAGDSIILCCNGGTQGDTCVGAPTECIFPLGGATIGVNDGPLTPSISGTLGNPITVTYCNSGNGCSATHTIRISGDHNQNDTWSTPPDLERFIESTGQDYIEFQCGTLNIIFEETGAHDNGMFELTGAKGWVFDGCHIRGDGDKMWEWAKLADDATNVSHVWWADNAGGDRGKVFKLANGTCPFTFRNGIISHSQGTVFRNIVNLAFCTTEIDIIENNEIYNVLRVNDTWANWDWANDEGKKIIYRNNYFHDNSTMIDFEHENFDHLIEDNIFLCLGEWQVMERGMCFEAMVSVGVENTGGDPCANSSGIDVKRNIIGSREDPDDSSPFPDCRVTSLPAGCGAPGNPAIRIDTQCNTPGSGCTGTAGCAGKEDDWIIENNIILRHWPRESGFQANKWQRAAIGVSTNQANVIKIRNNTIYDSELGIAVNGRTAEISPDIINNWIFKSNDNGTRDEVELWLDSNANGGTINNNNIYHGGLGTD